MSLSKHTPGPWVLDDYEMPYTYRLEGFAVRTRALGSFDAFIAEDKANRSLIEAAPLLLEALEAILEQVVIDEADENFSTELEFRHDKARAAIAKARGNE